MTVKLFQNAKFSFDFMQLHAAESRSSSRFTGYIRGCKEFSRTTVTSTVANHHRNWEGIFKNIQEKSCHSCYCVSKVCKRRYPYFGPDDIC